MKKFILLAAVLILSQPLFTNFARAAEDYAGNIGVSYGLSVPDLSGTTSRTIMGAQGTAKLGSEWGIGGYYMTSDKTETSSQISGDVSYQLYGVKGTYHFEGDARGVYLGALVGISKIHVITVDTSPTHYGVLAGYDKMLGQNFSVGGEFSYIAVGSSSTTNSGTTYNINGFNTLNFLAGAKLWF